MKVLIDTNVLLDWLMKREPFAVGAAQVIRLAELKVIEAHFAAITLTNAYYIAKVPKGAAFAMTFVESIRQLGRIVPLDDGMIHQAAALPMVDLDDAIQAASAMQSGADFIVTRDALGFANSPVVPIEPIALIKLLATK